MARGRASSARSHRTHCFAPVATCVFSVVGRAGDAQYFVDAVHLNKRGYCRARAVRARTVALALTARPDSSPLIHALPPPPPSLRARSPFNWPGCRPRSAVPLAPLSAPAPRSPVNAPSIRSYAQPRATAIPRSRRRRRRGPRSRRRVRVRTPPLPALVLGEQHQEVSFTHTWLSAVRLHRMQPHFQARHRHWMSLCLRCSWCSSRPPGRQ